MKTKSTYQRVYDCALRYKNITGRWPTIRIIGNRIKVRQSDIIRVAMASPKTLDYTVSGTGVWDWSIEVIG